MLKAFKDVAYQGIVLKMRTKFGIEVMKNNEESNLIPKIDIESHPLKK